MNLPLRSMGSAIRKSQPKMFWLSASHLASKESFLAEYKEFVASIPQETVIVLGGRALDDQIRPHMKYTAHCDNLQ
ncbi:MAG: MerR family transcriptional regulator, partial [bacterium]